jgi:hypothetical protein
MRSDFLQGPTSELSPTARVFNQAEAAMPEVLSTTASCSMSRTGLSATTAGFCRNFSATIAYRIVGGGAAGGKNDD